MNTPQQTPFRVALTADFYDESGAARYADFGLDRFEGHDHVVVSKFSEQVELEELLSTADFVSLHCPLTEQTRGLIGADQLGLMKSNAYLLNLARGGIVDEESLYDALASRSIAGAAVDCFENEPVVTPHRLGELDNVLLAPHSIAWTDELFRDIGRTACQSLLDLSRGQRPHGAINPEVLDHPAFDEKWDRVRNAAAHQ